MRRAATAIEVLVVIAIVAIIGALIFSASGCIGSPDAPVASSGVQKTDAEIEVGSDGLTVEQRNIKKRLELENKPGSVKHLYVISAMSGQVILYSTVDCKATSSGKRLSPYHVAAMDNQGAGKQHHGVPVKIGDQTHHTSEVLQDDGTYGSSIPYLYWFDTQGRYHQHYVSGGQIVHVSDEPISVGKIIINFEEN